MQFTIDHFNINVLDLDRSLAFYGKALNLSETHRMEAGDGSYIIVYLGDGKTPNRIELTWLAAMDRPYNLGDEEFHIAFRTPDFEAAHRLHAEMGCICFENTAMGVYFIKDPDGYWLEILPMGVGVKKN